VSGRITVAVVRRLIADAPWAQERLRPYAGHEVVWDLAGLRGRVVLDAEGLPAALPEPQYQTEPPPGAGLSPTAATTPASGRPQAQPVGAGVDGRRTPGVRLRLDAVELDALGGGFDALMRRVSIEGNAGLAAELAYVARHLRPDPEEWLAPWLGDAAAERTGRAVRSALRWTIQAGERAARASAEFAVHEARLLPDAARVSAHCRAVDELREAADRLGERIARIEAAGSARCAGSGAAPGRRPPSQPGLPG
jgi:ubiquinone biosynthesis protein UbiJ